MSTITREFTKEQLIERIQHRVAVIANYPGVEEAQLDAAIFKIALASLEAGPAISICIEDGWPKPNSATLIAGAERLPDGTYELYTAPPRHVVPDEIEPDDSNTYDYVDGWNACRTAMIDAGR
jgi:hypothetical protein